MLKKIDNLMWAEKNKTKKIVGAIDITFEIYN